MTVHDIDLQTLSGEPANLGEFAGSTILVVNVASQCGLTPQYTGLQRLYDQFADRGLVVAGFPCNQFGAQEPGTSEEISEFCSANYNVTFPMFAKIDVNGPGRHPLYTELTEVADAEGKAGDIQCDRARRQGACQVPAAHRARGARGGQRHRGEPGTVASLARGAGQPGGGLDVANGRQRDPARPRASPLPAGRARSGEPARAALDHLIGDDGALDLAGAFPDALDP